MTAIDTLVKENKLDLRDFDRVTKLVYHSCVIDESNEDDSNQILVKKEELLSHFGQFLEKYLELEFLSSKKEKLELINFIDKINLQKELLELLKNESHFSQIQKAGQKLGKKSQSAFRAGTK